TAMCYTSGAVADCDDARHTFWVTFTIVIVADTWRRPRNYYLRSKPRERLQSSTICSVPTALSAREPQKRKNSHPGTKSFRAISMETTADHSMLTFKIRPPR